MARLGSFVLPSYNSKVTRRAPGRNERVPKKQLLINLKKVTERQCLN